MFVARNYRYNSRGEARWSYVLRDNAWDPESKTVKSEYLAYLGALDADENGDLLLPMEKAEQIVKRIHEKAGRDDLTLKDLEDTKGLRIVRQDETPNGESDHETKEGQA